MEGEVGSVPREAEAHDLPIGRPGGSRWDRTPVSAAVQAHPVAATALALLALATASAALHTVLVGWVHGPKVFMDELGYEQMAKSFAQTGHFSLFGKSGLAYSPLYPLALSPIYALTSSAQTAYEWAKVENAVLISLSVFPIYAIARSVLSRSRSTGVAALSLLAPLMLYSSFEMSESLAYPLCLVAIWAMIRAVRQPSLRNDALLLIAIALAATARLQLVALVPAAVTAVLVVGLLRPPKRESTRGRSLLRAVSQHRLLFGIVGGAVLAGLTKTGVNGGALPLAGRYANVGTAHASPLRVLELFFQHLAELDWAVGVIPFAAALLAGYVLVRAGFPRKPLIFASVAVSTTFWLLLEVAYDAAAFDATTSHLPSGSGAVDLPRIHERYLIYLVPLFLVAFVAALPLFRKRITPYGHLTAATAAALFPALVPFAGVINRTIGVDSFALDVFAKTRAGQVVPIAHATTLIVFLSALLAAVYLAAVSRPSPSMAVLMTAVAFLWISTVEQRSEAIPVSLTMLDLPAHAGWVDRVVGNDRDVSLVGGDGVQPGALRESAFWNMSIIKVYSTCSMAFGADFGEQRLALAKQANALGDPSGTIHTRYAVVPAAFGIAGRVLARDEVGRLVLIAPTGGTLRIPARNRSLLRCRS